MSSRQAQSISTLSLVLPEEESQSRKRLSPGFKLSPSSSILGKEPILITRETTTTTTTAAEAVNSSKSY
jgi:hypothetical protein